LFSRWSLSRIPLDKDTKCDCDVHFAVRLEVGVVLSSNDERVVPLFSGRRGVGCIVEMIACIDLEEGMLERDVIELHDTAFAWDDCGGTLECRGHSRS
jgi:hypothetical protein